MPSPTTPPAGYTLHHTAPVLFDYLHLRSTSGLSPKTPPQAVGALSGSWHFVHIEHDPTGEVVAMGRTVGDGGWYFHIADMAVRPTHQRRGLGGWVLQALLHRIRKVAPPGAYVTLLGDGPGRRLYVQHGFEETAPESLGMAMVLRAEEEEGEGK